MIRLSSTINTCSVPPPSIGVVTFVLREDDRLMANEEEGEVADTGLRGEDSTRAAMADGGATARVLMKNRKTWERHSIQQHAMDNRAHGHSPLPCPTWLSTSIRPPRSSVISVDGFSIMYPPTKKKNSSNHSLRQMNSPKPLPPYFV